MHKISKRLVIGLVGQLIALIFLIGDVNIITLSISDKEAELAILSLMGYWIIVLMTIIVIVLISWEIHRVYRAIMTESYVEVDPVEMKVDELEV